MGLGIGHWDGVVLRGYPGAFILDTSFNESRQAHRYLVCHEGQLFFLQYHHGSGQVSRTELNRDHGVNVTCSVKKRKSKR